MVIYISVPMVSARVLNFGKTIPLKNLKAHNYGNIHLCTNGVVPYNYGNIWALTRVRTDLIST